MRRFKDILFVVETGEACKPALERAVTLADNNQANLTVVDVVESVGAGIEMPEGGLRAADLVVMGTVGRTGVPGFIVGNTAEMILSQIDCSVLAIKPPGFVTPVTVEG